MAQNQHAINANVFCVLFASLKADEEFRLIKSMGYVWGCRASTACLKENVSRETFILLFKDRGLCYLLVSKPDDYGMRLPKVVNQSNLEKTQSF
jgi:hypothetical protein